MARSWEPLSAAFRQSHGEWLARHANASEVLYRLSEKIRGALARRPPHGRAILQAADIAAEKAFDNLCLGFFAEGLYQNKPIVYRHLQPPSKPPSAKELQEMGLDLNKKAMNAGASQADELQLRNKGYIGRLVTDSSFLRDRDTLRAEWLALPEDQRPVFPLSRTTLPLEPASEAVSCFQGSLDAFCERYSLQSMVTWELPDPVGPLLAGGPWPAHILQSRQVVIALPSHFPVTDKDELLEMIRNQQQLRLRDAGLDPTCVAPRSYETYAHLFEIDHYERVVIGRYGCSPRPKGFISQLIEGLMAHLDIGQEHLQTLRKSLAAFKRGSPHKGKFPR